MITKSKPNQNQIKTKLKSNQTSDLLENKNKNKELEDEKKCVYLRLNIFNTYWNILKRNYKDTQHNEIDFKYYYSIFKEYEEKDFVNAVKMVLKYQPYFPRVDEIVKYLPDNEEELEVPKWFNEEHKAVNITQQEQEELEKLIKEMEE